MSTEEQESFISRWSRRKRKAREQARSETPGKQATLQTPVELPPVEQLTPESDFSGFMDARVEDSLRRTALKKLFSDPRFNVTDGLDDYAEDYSTLEVLPASLVDRLRHARRTLRGPDPNESRTTEMSVAGQANDAPEESLVEPQELANSGSGSDDTRSTKDSDEKEERNG